MGRRTTRARTSVRPQRSASHTRWVAAGLAALTLAGACSSRDGLSGGTTDPEASISALTGEGAPDAGVNPDGTDPLPRLADDDALPIVFIHGHVGSAQQYESQAQRFAANGYPPDRIVAYDHDGSGSDIEHDADGVAEIVGAAVREFDAEQVYLVGHSRGTAVAARFLRDERDAARVAKYIAIDGEPCPEVVPCLALTQDLLTGQAHVEAATSAESFALQYEFLVGEPPAVVDIVPQRAPVEIFGRAVSFPANTGRSATLDIWRLDAATGHRVGEEPVASVDLDERGGFGPIRLQPGAHYEYLLTTEGSPVQHHVYLQPYVRSSQLVRLLSSEPDGPPRANTNTGSDHTALVVMRMREWYAADDADLEGDQRDVLTVAPPGEDPIEVLSEVAGNGDIAMHLHDDAATPGRTTLAPLPYFSEQPFQAGVDVHLPADAGASGTITVTNVPRGDTSRTQTLNVPNWPSDRHIVTVVFTDYPVD